MGPPLIGPYADVAASALAVAINASGIVPTPTVKSSSGVLLPRFSAPPKIESRKEKVEQ